MPDNKSQIQKAQTGSSRINIKKLYISVCHIQNEETKKKGKYCKKPEGQNILSVKELG